MWKLAPNHANIFSKQQTVCKMSDHELLSPDNSDSGWDNVLLAQKINKQGVAIRMSWYALFEKINSWGGEGPLFRSAEYSFVFSRKQIYFQVLLFRGCQWVWGTLLPCLIFLHEMFFLMTTNNILSLIEIFINDININEYYYS